MNGTRRLHDAGQSIWLDNITRGLLGSGGLRATAYGIATLPSEWLVPTSARDRSP